MKVLGPFRSEEQKFQGANWPGSYWSIRSWEQIDTGAKRLWITKAKKEVLDEGAGVSMPSIYKKCTLSIKIFNKTSTSYSVL